MILYCDTCGLDDEGLRARCADKDPTLHARLDDRFGVGARCGGCSSEVRRLETDGRCFTCAYWLDQIDNEPELRAVINGTHYRIEPERGGGYPTSGAGRGFSGRKQVIRFTDGRTPPVVTTTNLWYQGKVPQLFRDRLPDNAEFVREVPG